MRRRNNQQEKLIRTELGSVENIKMNNSYGYEICSIDAYDMHLCVC